MTTISPGRTINLKQNAISVPEYESVNERTSQTQSVYRVFLGSGQ